MTPQQHPRLKALAALQGKTIKESVLEGASGTAGARVARAELEAMLDRRLLEAASGVGDTPSVADVFRQARDRPRRRDA